MPFPAPATESAMVRSLRDRTLLEQLGVGSYARYGQGRQRLRRPAVPPAPVRHVSQSLYSHGPRVPPTIITGSSLNRQELLRTMPHHRGLVPSDPPSWVITDSSPPKLNEAGDPPLENLSHGPMVPYPPPGARNALTNDPIRNRIRANQFPQRQLMTSRPNQEPHTSRINSTNRVAQYPPGQLAIPRFHENSRNGYNDRLGLSFHPPLVIGFNRGSRAEQEDTHTRPQVIDYCGPGNPSLLIPSNPPPTPPSNFEASAWERLPFTKPNSGRTTRRNFEASVWRSYSSTRTNSCRSNSNTVASSHRASDHSVLEFPSQETPAQTSHLTLAMTSQPDSNAPSSSRDYVVQRGLTTRLGLPSAEQRSDRSSPPESSKPGIPRPIASFLGLPSEDERGSYNPSPGPTTTSVQGNFDRPPPFELSATPSGLLYLPTHHIANVVPSLQKHINASSAFRPVTSADTDPTATSRRHFIALPQNPSGIAPIELTETDHVPVRELHTRRAGQILSKAQTIQPLARVHNDKLLTQLQQFATGNAIIEDAIGTSPSGIPRLVPVIDPIYGGTRPTMAGITRPRPGQEIFQPKPRNPFRGKESRNRNCREAPETEGDGARKLSLRGGEAPNYMAMVPLQPPRTGGRTTVNTPRHTSALQTTQLVNQAEELAAIEQSQPSLVPVPNCDPIHLAQEPVQGAEDSHGIAIFEWKLTEPTFDFIAGPAVALNSRQITPSPTIALNLPRDATDAAETGPAQALSTPSPLPGRDRRTLSSLPSGSSGLPTPPPSWRLPSHQGLSRIPVPRGGGAYHGHRSLQRRIGLSSIIPPSPTRPPTPPKTPLLISVPTIQKLHQPPVSEDQSSVAQDEDSSLGETPFSVKIDEVEPSPTKSRSLPSFNPPKKSRKRVTEESLRVWILRQCYLAKLNAAYEEGIREQEEVDGEGLMDLGAFVGDEGSFI